MPPTICPSCGYPMDGRCANGCASRTGFGARFRRTPRNATYATAAWQALSKRVRSEWIAAHGYVCPGWRRAPHPSRDLTADHVIPLIRGGAPLDRGNVAVLCRSCQARKSLSERDHGRRAVAQPDRRHG